MSNAWQLKDATRIQDVEGLIAAIGEMVKLLDCIVLVDVDFPMISGIQSADEGQYRELLPLGDGVHIVLSVGDMPTKLLDGIHEIEV